jgi:hypothetical protein
MKSNAKTIKAYLESLPVNRIEALTQLHEVIKLNIPNGFEAIMNYGMPGFVVPHSIYPDGYHCDPKLPLPFINYASQKHFIALYHCGIYAKPDLLKWFVDEYPKHCSTKLDVGKSCIRFKKPEYIPFELIAELARKMTVEDWISIYEKNLKR